MGRETHIEHTDAYLNITVINIDPLLTAKDLISYGTWLAVTRYNECVLLVSSPFLKDLQRIATVKHPWRSKANHRLVYLNHRGVHACDMLEIK